MQEVNHQIFHIGIKSCFNISSDKFCSEDLLFYARHSAGGGGGGDEDASVGTYNRSVNTALMQNNGHRFTSPVPFSI